MRKTKLLAAFLMVFCFLFNSVWAEEMFIDEEGFEEYTEDTEYDAAADPFAQELYNAYVPATINTDAEIKLGYVAAGNVSINPLYCDERDLISLNRLVFESVVDLDEEFKPIPLLADSWTSEGKKWTFYLRKGIVFHNGADLTAADVYLTWQRFMYDGQSSPYYNRMSMIESMTVKDGYTLEVQSKYSGYITLYAMTFPVMQSSTLSDAMSRGTGPYWYTEYAQGVGVRLENNPLWWKNDAKIQSIAAINYPDSAAALEALQKNEIDMMYTRSNRASLYRKLSNLASMDYATNTFEVLIPNLNQASIMSDLRIRQAVMYGINRAMIAENAYGGMGVQCEVPVNPASWLYESQSALYYYSPERALQLIYDCGWKDLTGDGYMNQIDGVHLKDLEIELLTYNEPTNSVRENACNIIKDYLATVGINVHVNAVGKERCKRKIKERDYDLALVGLEMSDVPELGELLKKGGEIDLNNYNNEDMNNLIDQIPAADSEEALKNIFSQIQMKVVNELPVMGLVFRTGTILSHRSLSGLRGISESNILNGIEFMTNE